MNLYPLLMAPSFRHGAETPWGGHMLRDALMKDAPEDGTGESLEISALPGHESTVVNGPHAGTPLPRMIELWGEALTGAAGGEFPLLLKLLDPVLPLSVQVHPDDAFAQAHEGGRCGKTEAWIILNTEPGGRIIYGVDTHGEPLKKIVAEGRLKESLRWQSVRPGDVYYIPGGMLHALCEGVLAYEIQQTSDLTYRFWDWDRVDENGNSRELHLEKALGACKPELRLENIEGATVLCKGGSRTYYISDNHFELCRLNLSGKMPLESGRMLFLTPLSPCALRWGDEEMTLKAFDSVLVPAALEGVVLEGETKVLMSSLPDRERLREELGYRAENVAGLVE
ncbi:MAG: class I mannose-6-phosphate isomerase [Clostridia bacterium]|nr:class I mannose-6-phosphate isomerase [Clostridia bacterium]